MSTCYADGVALQPAGGAGVVLAGAHMVQPHERDIFVPIRPVPQKRLVNPLGGWADGVAPAIVVPRFSDGTVGSDQRSHMSQPVYHIVAGVLWAPIVNPQASRGSQV
jgi:hypothetical protein